ncbi:hypothetical protein L6164_035728 [Bauhinia variegata]|uniref:Uncharacterized protein n=1 Tax=Bauhinia variegata TaxID=167791 RepID=A0ACB9KEX6_BAUVA|nr:hypothetical protein L6164_035728 [Bauhinia variegata]
MKGYSLAVAFNAISIIIFFLLLSYSMSVEGMRPLKDQSGLILDRAYSGPSRRGRELTHCLSQQLNKVIITATIPHLVIKFCHKPTSETIAVLQKPSRDIVAIVSPNIQVRNQPSTSQNQQCLQSRSNALPQPHVGHLMVYNTTEISFIASVLLDVVCAQVNLVSPSGCRNVWTS